MRKISTFNSNRLEMLFNKISYQGRRGKLLAQYNTDIDKFYSMSENEFIMECVETTASYEHKKMMITVFFITVIVSVVMEIWKFIYNTMLKLLGSEAINDQAFIKVVEILSLIVIALTLLVSAFLVFNLCKSLYLLSKKKLLLEEVKVVRERNE